MRYLHLNKGLIMKKTSITFLFLLGILNAQTDGQNSPFYKLDAQNNTLIIKKNLVPTIDIQQKTQQTAKTPLPTQTKKSPQNSANATQKKNSLTINAIAVVVDNEPITTYDIEQTMKNLKLNRTQALNVLINDKMELSQMKQLGIVVNELELDENIKKFLAQNNLNLTQLQQSLKQKGQSYSSFRENFKKDLQTRKLYDRIASFNKTDFSDGGAKEFYEQHKEQFSIWTQINVNIYSSNQAELLENIIRTKKASIKPHNVILNPTNSDPRLLVFLSQIPVNDFSPILNGANGYELYEVKAKSDPQIPDYEQVKDEVLNAYINKQRQDFTQDYFEKLRSKVTVEYFK